MITVKPNEEFIQKNYNKTVELIRQAYKIENEERSLPSLLTMIQELGVRYATAPASSSKNFYCAFPGGLCYHNLHVLQWIVKVANALAPKEHSLESLLKVTILSDIGKVGNKDKDLYLPISEDWKKRNGHYYESNPDIEYMKSNQRSLHLASQFGIPLTEEEYLAILLADPSEESNRTYKYKEPKLALILQFAKQWAQKVEKSITVDWP